MHRSFFIDKSSSREPRNIFYQQRSMSEIAVLEGAVAVVEGSKQLIAVGYVSRVLPFTG